MPTWTYSFILARNKPYSRHLESIPELHSFLESQEILSLGLRAFTKWRSRDSDPFNKLKEKSYSDSLIFDKTLH